ncbi:MAG: kelch repeat-containing protein, partial [Actinomycetota bacterium]
MDPETHAPALDHGRRTRRRRLAAGVAAAVAVSAIAVVGVVRTSTDAPLAKVPSPSSVAVAQPWAGYATGWTKLPLPPEVRPGTANVWTGDQVLMWGGAGPPRTDYAPTDDGYAFDPTTKTWSTMPAAPMSGKFAHGVWTGDRAIFLYGRSALAYSPASRDWQTLPDIPPNAGTGVVVWTGERLFVW